MNRRCFSRLIAACTLLTLLPAAQPLSLAQQGNPVNAGVPSAQQLRAPADRQSFDFMIFGDRTGGPPKGLQVLAQGVEMANQLDVDMVLCVGDLVPGYNDPITWVAQMREFKNVVKDLRMPFYPVPGNHDVYARPDRPGGNTDLYLEHFGPLYYSFDYKWAHFIVLFSDEAFSFSNPAMNQNFSAEQMDWLKKDLTATDAQQVFVFLHHPRWTKRYQGCNWPEIHQMFVEFGRPVTVFAGHIHLYRSDGEIDNVRYYTLATTGGELGKLRESAALHHVDFVRVRPDNVAVAVLPVGNVYADDFVLGEELETMYELDRGGWCKLDGKVAIESQAGCHSSFEVQLSNPTDREMRFTAKCEAGYGWNIESPALDQKLAPGETTTLKAATTAPALGEAEPKVIVRAVAYYPLRSGLVQSMPIERDIPVTAEIPTELAAADPDNNGVLVLDGSSAVRVAVPERLEQYTLECWVRGSQPKGSVALVTKTESSAYGIFWCDQSAHNPLPTGYVGVKSGYIQLPALTAWDWSQWTHLALVFDGKKAAFYVNGRLQKEQSTTAGATHNRQPLYIGADPDGNGQAGRFFVGAIDEVRLSAVARYEGEFKPRSVFAPDAETVFLMHFDHSINSLHPDNSGRGHHGWSVGSTKIERMPR